MSLFLCHRCKPALLLNVLYEHYSSCAPNKSWLSPSKHTFPPWAKIFVTRFYCSGEKMCFAVDRWNVPSFDTDFPVPTQRKSNFLQTLFPSLSTLKFNSSEGASRRTQKRLYLSIISQQKVNIQSLLICNTTARVSKHNTISFCDYRWLKHWWW